MNKKILWLSAGLLTLIAGFIIIDAILEKPQKTQILTSDKVTIAPKGTVTGTVDRHTFEKSGKLTIPQGQTASYESNTIEISHSPNAAVIQWNQSKDASTNVEVRTKGSKGWSEWTPATESGEGKDNVEKSSTFSSLILANSIKEVQFRLKATASSADTEIDLSTTTLQSIDSKTGPNSNQPLYKKLFSYINGSAYAAITNGPSVISRADWGCPEPNTSEWAPEYNTLKRAIVHHTATTEPSDTYATVRAIWQYHSKSLGWGDIGYNYLVDYSGKIFEGRLYDRAYAEKNRVDVIAGHAYGNNNGTTGVSAIGTYSTIRPTVQMTNSMSNIIAYKLAPYSIDPRGDSGFGPGTGGAIIGHREVYPTTCPGDALYSQMQQIKNNAFTQYTSYNKQYLYDYQHINTVLLKDGASVPLNTPLLPTDNAKIKIFLKNTGGSTWSNTQNPVVLGTNTPENRISSVYHPSWLSQNRTSGFQTKLTTQGTEVIASSVAPGEVGIFEFALKIPSILRGTDLTPITQNEYLKPVIDNVTWFPHDIGMHFPVTIKPISYSYSVESQGIFTDVSLTKPTAAPLQPDTDYYLSINLKNTGTAPWTKEVFHLGTKSPHDRQSIYANSTWISPNRLPSMEEAVVNPGEVAHFKAKIHTPISLRSNVPYREYVAPVADGVTWLQDIGIYWDTSVQRTNYSWQIINQDLYSDAARTISVKGQNLTKGSPYYAKLVIKNTGNTPWRKGSFNFAGASPYNRDSKFYDPSWLSPSRSATIKEEIVNPGDLGTVEFVFKTSASSVNTREYFTPVVENYTWLVDYGLYWDLNFKLVLL